MTYSAAIQKHTFDDTQLAIALKGGAIGVLPTDTLYGLVASAFAPEAVQRIYELKGRDDHKPCIILVPDVAALEEFGIPEDELAAVAKYWPGGLSVIFSTIDPKLSYLQRELGNPPFRVPGNERLREFLRTSGPLIAPSANHQGEAPATTVAEAQTIFGDTIDFYVDGGTLKGEPSTLVKVLPGGKLHVIRQGVVQILP